MSVSYFLISFNSKTLYIERDIYLFIYFFIHFIIYLQGLINDGVVLVSGVMVRGAGVHQGRCVALVLLLLLCLPGESTMNSH